MLDEINLEAQDISTDYVSLFDRDNSSHRSANNPDFNSLDNAKIINGELGENYVYNNMTRLISSYAEDVYHTSKDYPTSPYDIEYTEHGIKKYLEVKASSGSKEVFNMSSAEIKFMKKYKDNYILIFISNVKSNFPTAKKFTCDKILRMRREFPTIRFYGN